MGRAGILMAVAAAAVAAPLVLSGQIGPALALLPLAALGGAVWAHAGVTTIDDDGIAYDSPLGSFRLRWSDITAVEVDGHLLAVVFRSGKRRLAIIGPSLWTQAERSRTWNHLRRRIEALDLPVRHSPHTPFVLSRGTRAPRI